MEEKDRATPTSSPAEGSRPTSRNSLAPPIADEDEEKTDRSDIEDLMPSMRERLLLKQASEQKALDKNHASLSKPVCSQCSSYAPHDYPFALPKNCTATSATDTASNAKLANCWSSPEAGEIFKVRGSSYLHDRVKQPSARAVFELAESDLFGVHSVEPMNHVVKNLPNNCVQRAAAMEDGRFYIVVVIQAPGNPHPTWCLYFASPKHLVTPGFTPQSVPRALSRLPSRHRKSLSGSDVPRERARSSSRDSAIDENSTEARPFFIAGPSISLARAISSTNSITNSEGNTTASPNNNNNSNTSPKTQTGPTTIPITSATTPSPVPTSSPIPVPVASSTPVPISSTSSTPVPITPSSTPVPISSPSPPVSSSTPVPTSSSSPHMPPNYSYDHRPIDDQPIDPNFQTAYSRFISGDDTYRNDRWKIIPSIFEGNILVKKSIGKKPAIFPHKLSHTWIRGPNYLEIDCDVSSSRIASMLTAQVIKFASGVVVDLAFLVESTTAEELPERVLGNVRFYRPNLADCIGVDVHGTVVKDKNGKK